MADDKERKNGAAAASGRNQTDTVCHPSLSLPGRVTEFGKLGQSFFFFFLRGGGAESQIRMIPFSRLQGVLNPFGDYNLSHCTGKVNKTDSFASHIDMQTSESVRIRLQCQCAESLYVCHAAADCCCCCCYSVLMLPPDPLSPAGTTTTTAATA